MPAVVLKRASIVGIGIPATFLIIAGWIFSGTIAYGVLPVLHDVVALAPTGKNRGEPLFTEQWR
jgi:hypothetical protein